MKANPIVTIECMTYNHAPYITDAMNGFCLQKTNFPFVAVIVDDASTDGEPEVIKSYLNEHFLMEEARQWETDDASFIEARHKENENCWFAVVLLKYNFWQKKKDKSPLTAEWYKDAKYIAWCEGDDYWTASDKLQKQFDFLESNKDYSMCCCRAKRFSVKNNDFKEKDCYCRKGDGELSVKDIIRKGGLYIPSCSLFYRKALLDIDYPEYWRNSSIGDYPLQIYLSLVGKVFYFDSPMVVYRVENNNAWTGRHNTNKDYSEADLDIIRREVNMLKGFASDYHLYSKAFKGRIEFFINSKFRSYSIDDTNNKLLLNAFHDDIKQYSFKGRIDKYIRLRGNKYIVSIYFRTLYSILFHNYFD